MGQAGLVRVLITSTPGVGHIHPLVPIASALQQAGHDVTWATAAESCARVESLGFPALPAGMDVPQRRAEVAVVCPEMATAGPRDHRSYAYPFMFGAVAAPRMFTDLDPVFAAVRPDVVLHEPSELAAPPAAAARQIPHVGVGFGDIVPGTLLAAAAEQVADLWAAAGRPAPASCGLYDHLYLHQFPPTLSTSAPVGTMRAMRPLAFDGRTDDRAPAWTTRLGSERPCLYVTFGTEFAARAPFAAVLAAVDDLDADVVVTVGPRLEPGGLGPAPENVRVEQYVPQRFVLARSAAVVSHGGSGAVLGAAERGLPHLCLPLGADQFDNADAVSRCGAGVMLEPHEIDLTALRSAIDHIVGDIATRVAAAAIAAEIEAMPAPHEVVGAIESLAG